MLAAHKGKCIRALNPLQNRTHCSDEVPAVDLLQEVHDNLRIRLGFEDVPLCNELLL